MNERRPRGLRHQLHPKILAFETTGEHGRHHGTCTCRGQQGGQGGDDRSTGTPQRREQRKIFQGRTLCPVPETCTVRQPVLQNPTQNRGRCTERGGHDLFKVVWMPKRKTYWKDQILNNHFQVNGWSLELKACTFQIGRIGDLIALHLNRSGCGIVDDKKLSQEVQGQDFQIDILITTLCKNPGHKRPSCVNRDPKRTRERMTGILGHMFQSEIERGDSPHCSEKNHNIRGA